MGKRGVMGVVEARRENHARREGVRVVTERLQGIRARRQQAASDFGAAGKELDAIRASAAKLDARPDWHEQTADARETFFRSRAALTEIRRRLDEIPAARKHRWLRSAS